MTGRRNCSNGVCDVADCGDDKGGCMPSRGFSQPATQAEMTLLKDGVDFYDVEVINGVSLPVSFGPVNGDLKPDDQYFCGNPGSKYPKTKVGACSWDLQPPSNDYYQVTAGGNACQTSNECKVAG